MFGQLLTIILVTGQSDRLPSAGDEAGLDDDVNQSSEVNHETPATEQSQDVLTDLDTTDLEGGQGQPDSPPEILISEEVDDLEDEETDGEDVFEDDDVSYTNVEIGNINEDRTMSQSSSADTLSDMRGGSPRHKPTQLRKGVSEDTLSGTVNTKDIEIDISEAIQPPASTGQATTRDGDIGSITDDDIPLVYCVRLLCSRFLLTGYKQGLIADRQVRVSAKALALGCIGSALAMYPQAFLHKLHKSSSQEGQASFHISS